MNETDIQKIRKKGIPIPSIFRVDRYVLVEGDSMADIMKKTIEAVQDGKKPVVIIDERVQERKKVDEMRAHMTVNQMYLRQLKAMHRHIMLYKESERTPNDYILYPTGGI